MLAGSAAAVLVIAGVHIVKEAESPSPTIDDTVFREYLAFLAKYGKTSRSKEEFEERLSIFASNY